MFFADKIRLCTLSIVLFMGWAAAANPQLEEDWLFQCDNQPTLKKAAQEISWARAMAGRIATMKDAPDLSAEIADLLTLEKKIDAAANNPDAAQALYLAVRRTKHSITFKNPLIDFDKVVLIDNPYPKGKPGDITDEWGHEARHRNGFMAEDGGRLLITGLTPGSATTDVLKEHTGSFWRPELSYDSKTLLLSFRPKGDRSFHLYSCNIDGSNLKQLTFGDYDDLDPVYTPDGHIIFCTSRQHSYVRCMPMTHSFAVARCDGDGKNIYITSANGEPEYLPAMLNDGRVLFTRWEYTDKALWRVQSLWTCDPDGCNVQTFWGSQSVWPDVLAEARPIPGSNKVMFTGIGHHAWFNGSIGIIDPAAGLNYPDGLQRITRECPWPEVNNGPQDPPARADYHQSGNIYAYKTPHPLSEEYFLVSAREGGNLYSGPHHNWFFRLYLMDVYGNKELIYKGTHNAYHAIPLRVREMPPIKPNHTQWPEIGSGAKPADAVFYSRDVFENAPPILREKGRYIRVIQMDPKTYTTWHKTVRHDGPAVSVFQADGVKRVIGTVPIEDDGSVNFRIPSGQALNFQMLDENGQAIHVMRSFANAMPGETRGCFGCHETSMKTRTAQNSIRNYKMGKALKKPPATLTPPSWGAGESVGYTRFVQPVLDRHCAQCHQKEGTPAYKRLNMVYRPSVRMWQQNVGCRPDDISPFTEPYFSLVGKYFNWGSSENKNTNGVPENLAGLFIVEGYGTTDPENLETLPPYSAYSPLSKLVQNAVSGKHHGIKVSGVDAERLIAWVDCNGPYLGDEEIRSMYDPQSDTIDHIPPIRPRVATAPVIERFNLRQDGNTTALCGDLKLAPVNPESFDTAKRNRKVREILVKEALEVLGKQSNKDVKIELVDANYGAEKRTQVIDELRRYFTGSCYIPIGSYNEAFGDPVHGVLKDLRIAYKVNGGEIKHISLREDEMIMLPY